LDKFFTLLLKALAAALGASAIIVLEAVKGVFSGAEPSDVSPLIWGIVSFAGIMLANYLIGKLPKPAA